MVRKLYKYDLLSALLAVALVSLAIPAKAQTAAGFYGDSGGLDHGFSWNVNTNAIAFPANLSGGSQTALFGVSQNAVWFCGDADGGPDGAGVFQGILWNGANGSTPTALLDSGSQGSHATPSVDTIWSVNDKGIAIGQGCGQVAGYDVGFFAQIEWPTPSTIVDTNSLTAPDGSSISSGAYYGGSIYTEGYDFTGIGLNASGINNYGDISCTAVQDYGNLYYQGVIVHAGVVYVTPYTDAADPAATSWNISANSATCGYTSENAGAIAYGYTATVNTSRYTFGANGGSGNLANYGQGPNNNFQWFVDTNDNGSGSGQAVGFDIDSTGSFNHAVYDASDFTSQEVADDRGGNTTFLVGVANDGSSAGFETTASDGEAYWHAWGTKTGTPGPTVDFPEPSGAVGSKAFEVASNGAGPGVQTFTGPFKKNAYKPIVLKHGKTAKVSVVLTSAADAGGQVVTVTSSNPSVIGNFTLTVPAGQTALNNVKTPKVGKKAKGQTVTLTASAPGGSQSVTVTVK